MWEHPKEHAKWWASVKASPPWKNQTTVYPGMERQNKTYNQPGPKHVCVCVCACAILGLTVSHIRYVCQILCGCIYKQPRFGPLRGVAQVNYWTPCDDAMNLLPKWQNNHFSSGALCTIKSNGAVQIPIIGDTTFINIIIVFSLFHIAVP